MTTNRYQEEAKHLNENAIFNAILYTPKMHDLGTTQGSPEDYACLRKKILRVNFDELQLRPVSLQDNIFPQGSISSFEEKVQISPYILEFTESKFEDRNLDEVIPMILTKLNRAWDVANIKTLESIAKAGTDAAWKCCGTLIGSILSALAKGHTSESEKIIVMDKNLQRALSRSHVITSGDSSMSDWGKLKELLVLENATLLPVDDLTLPLSNTANDAYYYIIDKDFLGEYQGFVPYMMDSGYDSRTKEYWTQFSFSPSAFRKRSELAIERIKITALDLTKSPICPAEQ